MINQCIWAIYWISYNCNLLIKLDRSLTKWLNFTTITEWFWVSIRILLKCSYRVRCSTYKNICRNRNRSNAIISQHLTLIQGAISHLSMSPYRSVVSNNSHSRSGIGIRNFRRIHEWCSKSSQWCRAVKRILSDCYQIILKIDYR